MSKALFLDRDGTLILAKDYLSDPQKVELIPGAAEALRHALSCNYLLFLLTNQSGVGRGWYSLDDVHACNRRMLELLDLPEPGFTEVCIAPEKPDDPPKYRKPSPRFILEMVEKFQLDTAQCTMIGDHITDIESGRNAGIKVAALKTGKKDIAEQLLNLISEKVPLYDNLNDFVATLS